MRAAASGGAPKPRRPKLETEDGKERYRKRKSTVEPVFGIIKRAIGFTHFPLRGIENVTAEWTLTALAYNCRRSPACRPSDPP